MPIGWHYRKGADVDVSAGKCNAGDQGARDDMGRKESVVPFPENPPSNPALDITPGGVQMR